VSVSVSVSVSSSAGARIPKALQAENNRTSDDATS
jgi:hypothetical protein